MHNFGILYRFELKKLWNRKIVWITIIGMMLALIVSSVILILTDHYQINGKEISAYEDMIEKRQYARELEGRLLDDTLIKEMQKAYGNLQILDKEEIENSDNQNTSTSVTVAKGEEGNQDYRKYAYVYEAVANVLGDEGPLYEDAEYFYKVRRIYIKTIMEDQQLTEKEMSYWKKMEKKIEKPYAFHYTEGIERIWITFVTLGVMLLLLVAICLSTIFSEEHRNRTDQLILCSKYGKHQLYYAKIAAGMTLGASGAVVLFLSLLVPVLMIYGRDGMDASIQLRLASSFPLTMGQILFILFGIYLVAGILFSMVAMFGSALFRNSVAVMAVMVSGMLAARSVYIPTRWRILSQIWGLLPNRVISIDSVEDYRLVPWFGGYLNVLQAAPVIYILITVVLFVIGKRIFRNYQVSGR